MKESQQHPHKFRQPDSIEKFTLWIGSKSSVILHTVLFVSFLIAGVVGIAAWDSLLLVLTTAVSLEAIYMAIFIQMTVNRNTERLHEVAEDVEDVQEDIDEIQEDVAEMSEDVDEIQEDIAEVSEDIDELQEDVAEVTEDIDELQEDVAEMTEDEKEEVAEDARKQKQLDTLAHISSTLQTLIAEVESIKKAQEQRNGQHK